MIHLFEKNTGDWSKECDMYSREAYEPLIAIFRKAKAKNHSLHDVHYVIQSTLNDAMLQTMYDCI